jgi:hypothetical protein
MGAQESSAPRKALRVEHAKEPWRLADYFAQEALLSAMYDDFMFQLERIERNVTRQ